VIQGSVAVMRTQTRDNNETMSTMITI